MMDHTIGRALNYGQSGIPGKSKKPSTANSRNLRKAILQKKKVKK